MSMYHSYGIGSVHAPEQRRRPPRGASSYSVWKKQLRQWRRNMPKRRGNWRIRLPLALDKCKTAAGECWRFVGRVFRSITACGRHDYLKVDLSTLVGHPLPTDSSCRQDIEFEEVVKALNIGDRIRVLCDDGALVAEKISQTQFELIHCQVMSKLVH